MSPFLVVLSFCLTYEPLFHIPLCTNIIFWANKNLVVSGNAQEALPNTAAVRKVPRNGAYQARHSQQNVISSMSYVIGDFTEVPPSLS